MSAYSSDGPAKRAPEVAEAKQPEQDRDGAAGTDYDAQAAELSPPFVLRGNGMDKRYFHDGGPRGWLACDQGVVDAELTAYGALAAAGVTNIPQVYAGPPPTRMVNRAGEPVEAATGFWIEHIPHVVSFKPKMHVMLPLSAPKRRRMRELNADGGVVDASLAAIEEKLEAIAAVVGELTIAIHEETGRALIIDVGANQGQVGGEELADRAAPGLANIRKVLE